MVLVTSPRLLITHPSCDLQHCGHHNNALACVGDLDKIPTISQYNGKTIKIKNARRVQVVGHTICFSLRARILKYWLSYFWLSSWWNPRKIENLNYSTASKNCISWRESQPVSPTLYRDVHSVKLSSFCFNFCKIFKPLICCMVLLYSNHPGKLSEDMWY